MNGNPNRQKCKKQGEMDDRHLSLSVWRCISIIMDQHTLTQRKGNGFIYKKINVKKQGICEKVKKQKTCKYLSQHKLK